ncbi:MAG: DUF4007 family protein [Cyanobacteria bacterium SBLK]|nr:DUF4007 family protein [Cyanobacteria bacterium SBLK]
MTTSSIPGISPPSVDLVFARHETFHPRFGWLKKGYDKAKENPKIFLENDAPVVLGVGKNMVRSIRYWCRAFKILEDDRPSEFGKNLLDDEGWDPFLEDPASLWLLHWYLLRPTCEAAAWYFTFNLFRGIEFKSENLFQGLVQYRTNQGKNIVESSLKKDLTCILRMYVESRGEKNVSEDSLDCPFTQLSLIQRGGEAQQYSFRIGAKMSLPSEIIVAACLQFAAAKGGQKTISLSSLSYELGSPGLVFKLPESAIYNAIEDILPAWPKNLNLSDTAGIIQFSFQDDPNDLARAILEKYYQ